MKNKSLLPPQSSLGFFGIIRESLKTTSRNRNVLFRILFFTFVQFSQLDFAQKGFLAPAAVKDFALQLAKHPKMLQEFSYKIDQTVYADALNHVRKILLIKLLFMALFSINVLFSLVVIVSSSSKAYTATVIIDLKESNNVFKKTWKRPLVTSFYMILLSLGVVFLYFISIGITTIFANSWGFLFVGVMITLSVSVFFFYMAALWIVSMVVSVLEEGFSGVKAIGRASDLMKGKRVQGSLMMVLFAVVYGVAHQIVNYLTSYDLSSSVQRAIGILLTNGFLCLFTGFMYVVYTVFYHECKTSHEEKEGKGFYLPIATGDA